MSERINISSGTTWEEKAGYSRAVKVGNQVFVSGTVAVDKNGNTVVIELKREKTPRRTR